MTQYAATTISIPEAINAGQRVVLPTDANAIQVLYGQPDGRVKPCFSLADQIDQFKGAGMPVLVTAGRVKLRTNGTGIWDTFQAVAGKMEVKA